MFALLTGFQTCALPIVCYACPAGKTSSAGSTGEEACEDCIAGRYSETGWAACLICPAGKYSVQTTFVFCPAGHTSEPGSDSEYDCYLPEGTLAGEIGRAHV